MNRDFVLFNLREASEALINLIGNIESDKDYDFGDYVVEMSHLYHHINFAWNAKDASEAEARECSEENHEKWGQLPNQDELWSF